MRLCCWKTKRTIRTTSTRMSLLKMSNDTAPCDVNKMEISRDTLAARLYRVTHVMKCFHEKRRMKERCSKKMHVSRQLRRRFYILISFPSGPMPCFSLSFPSAPIGTSESPWQREGLSKSVFIQRSPMLVTSCPHVPTLNLLVLVVDIDLLRIPCCIPQDRSHHQTNVRRPDCFKVCDGQRQRTTAD